MINTSIPHRYNQNLMATPAVLSLRPAIDDDRSRLANLLHFETYVHRHLDWRRPLDWLGQHPYLVLESAGRLNAALACPPDPDTVAWIRLFAAMARTDLQDAWQALWPAAQEQLQEMQVESAAAIPLQDWFRNLLLASDFEHIDNVVVLDWVGEPPAANNEFTIRPMQETDLPNVFEVDEAAFVPLWRNSVDAIKLALMQSIFSTVIEIEGRIVAFQISTQSSQGLHLARLATHPMFQGRGLAKALVIDLQRLARQRGERRLTVNTQEKNTPSLSLYTKLGFARTAETFPVLEIGIG
jgi:ribosomal protein S18 acetylase RimI-like enzyme